MILSVTIVKNYLYFYQNNVVIFIRLTVVYRANINACGLKTANTTERSAQKSIFDLYTIKYIHITKREL